MRKKVASCTFTVELYMESIDYMSSHPPPFGMLEGIISAVVNVGRTWENASGTEVCNRLKKKKKKSTQEAVGSNNPPYQRLE